MPIGRFVLFSTLGAFLWSALLVWVGEQLGANWEDLRHKLQPFDSLILIAFIGLVATFIWWRIGMPGMRGRGKPAEPVADATPAGAGTPIEAPPTEE
jgi:hypothetical protein